MIENTYIEVRVASYRLALPAQCVGGVLTDVLVGDVTPFRGERLPVIDLCGGIRRSALAWSRPLPWRSSRRAASAL